MHSSLFERLKAWLAGDIGADYGIAQLQAAAGVASFSSQPPAVHFNPLGGVHGGYTATLFYVTASLQVNYLRPIGLAALPLRTEARVQQREGRHVAVQATLHDAQGLLCANASGVFTCLLHTASGATPSVGLPAR